MKQVSYLRYASGIFGLTLISQIFHSYNYAFYVDELGLAVSLATLAKVVFIGFDAINDIVLGRLSDKTDSKWGKRTPWIFIGAPFFALMLILAFSPNKNAGINIQLLFIYYVVISLLFELFATIMYINHGALFPIIYKSEKERANASVAKQSLLMIAMGIGASLPPFLFNKIGYQNTAIIYGVVGIIIVYICLNGLHETSFDYKTKLDDNIGLKSAFLDTYKNKRFLFYNFAQAFSLSVNAIIMTVFPFYAQYSLQISQSQHTILMLCLFLSAFVSMPLWKKMIIKNGVNNTWLISFLVYALTILTLLFAFDFWTGSFASILIGVGLAGIYITPDLIMAYIIDIDYKKNNIHREASFMAIGNFVQKLSLAISAIMVWLITSFFGFESGVNPGDYPGLTFSVLAGLIPVLLLAISYVFAKKYIHYDNTHQN